MAVDRNFDRQTEKQIDDSIAAVSQATAEHAATLTTVRAGYITGFMAALGAIEQNVAGHRRLMKRDTPADVSAVIAWAKQEMPMLRDDVDARVETRSGNVLQASDALIAKGLQSIVEWLSDGQNAALYAVLKEQDKQAAFLTEQNDRLASEAERHLHRIESLEQAGNLWMLASDAMNQLLEGQPEAQHEDQPLWVRVALLVERLRAELAQAQELTNRAKHA